MSLPDALCVVIHSAASGEELLRLDADNWPLLAETEVFSVGDLKRVLVDHIQLSRFRQRLLNDGGELLRDEMNLSLPVTVQLVKLEFLPPDQQRDTAFMDACAQNRVDEVESMLHDPQDPCIAVVNGNVEVVRLLLEARADPDMCVSVLGNTPLFVAADFGNVEVARLLLESGADKEKSNGDGETPLHYAIHGGCSGYCHVVRLLLESGADPDKPDQDGDPPLVHASATGNLEIVQLLLNSGADKEKGAPTGETPLICAAQNGHLEVVRNLLESAAHVDKCEDNGATPLHMASEHGQLEVVQLLLESGAERNKFNTNGETPLHLATVNGHAAVVHLLETFCPLNRQRHMSHAAERLPFQMHR